MCLRVGLYLVDGKGLIAPGVHIQVDPAIMIQNKIANRVCALYREGVVVPDVHKPGVLGGKKVASRLISPQL